MSKTNKVKSLLSLKGIKNNALVDVLKIARPQALTTKYSRDAFSGDDLIKIAELTNTRLSFIDNETNKEIISFDMNDIK